MEKKSSNLGIGDLSKSFFHACAIASLSFSLSNCATVPQDTSANVEGEPSTAEVTENVDPSILGEADSTSVDTMNFTSEASSDSSGGDPWFGKRRAPKVAVKPFEKAGRLMNAYYFVRSPNETWSTLSTLIYGRSDRGDFLKTWNDNKALRVGSLIYYNSALRPDDTENMRIFAEDFGLAMEKYEVKSGDSLSLIGNRLYGNLQTWMEIASLNPQLRSPDQIEVGDVLTLQPATLDTKAILERVMAEALNPNPNQTPIQEEPMLADQGGQPTTDQSDQAQVLATTQQTNNSESTPPSSPKETSPNLTDSSNLSGLTHYEKLMIVAAALIVLGLGAMILKRRKQARKDQEAAWLNPQNTVTKMTNQG